MPVAVVCQQCGREFTATRPEVAAGPAVWRRCPACREVQPHPEAEAERLPAKAVTGRGLGPREQNAGVRS